jgi:hypothetical protein
LVDQIFAAAVNGVSTESSRSAFPPAVGEGTGSVPNVRRPGFDEFGGHQLLVIGEQHDNPLARDFVASRVDQFRRMKVRRFITEVSANPVLDAVRRGEPVGDAALREWRLNHYAERLSLVALYRALHAADIPIVTVARYDIDGQERENLLFDRIGRETEIATEQGGMAVAMFGTDHLTLDERSRGTEDQFRFSFTRQLVASGFDVVTCPIVGGMSSISEDGLPSEARDGRLELSTFMAGRGNHTAIHLSEYVPRDNDMDRLHLYEAAVRRRYPESAFDVQRAANSYIRSVRKNQRGALALVGNWLSINQAYGLAAVAFAGAVRDGDEAMRPSLLRTAERADGTVREWLTQRSLLPETLSRETPERETPDAVARPPIPLRQAASARPDGTPSLIIQPTVPTTTEPPQSPWTFPGH